MLTTVGIGTWALGGPWQFGWGPQDDGQAVDAIAKGIELGINWIDTAPAYGCGHSEELVAKALKQTNIKPLIATKCGILWNEKREKVCCLKPESIRKECEDSLKRLDIDVIDLYQMHWPEPQADFEDAWAEMAKLKQQGRVRHIGVSNYKLEQIQRVQKIHPVASLQPPYSMLHRQVEAKLLGFCKKNNIGVVVYSPMQRGLLTGKFSHERLANLPADDHRRTNPDFTEPKFSATLELVEKLKPVAEKNNITLAQLAIAWVLRRAEVASAIVGVRKPGQIEETYKASDIDLRPEDVKNIEKLLVKREEKIKRHTN
jgi:aryl-alcohol dehydrogenase-like predicted oxidoreductase